ncbi:conjugal transfer protein TraF [Bermanella sp. R86510]|uniref:conjugal transfer protein TraF n=1 Tax=unclassified Bermanella TaxID=2627862 RepID=UPI0037CAE73A
MHFTHKKLLLGAAISLAAYQAHAVPFMPTDARAMGMGGTGVASAEIASTVQFNPALLATTRDDDHFGLKVPQFMAVVADDDGFIDEVEDFDESDSNGNTNIDNLQNALDIATGPGGLDAIVQAVNDIDNATTTNELKDARNDLNSSVDNLRGVVISTQGATQPDSDLVVFSDLIASDLDDLNSKALRLNLGANVALAVPSKKFSLALSAGGTATFSGRVLVSTRDTDLMRNYTLGTNLYLDSVADVQQDLDALIEAEENGTPQQVIDAGNALDESQANLTGFSYGGVDGEGDTVIYQNGEIVEADADLQSEVEMIGVAIADIGLTASRVFNIKGHDIAFGVTPKVQKITVFDYVQRLDSEEDFDEDSITENTEEYTELNVDLGAAYQFGAENQFQAGVVIKNLLGKEFESARYADSNGALGTLIEVNPQIRAGVSHKTSWTKVAFDLDLTENDPVAFEDATQYASIGAELNVWRTLQLRAGYRANLAGSDQDVMTAGIGISPAMVHLDIGAMVNTSDPEKEAGVAIEFGVEF